MTTIKEQEVSVDKMREDFEAWWGDQEKPSEFITLRVVKQIAWHSWQVSRMRLVVKLPEKTGDEIDGFDNGIDCCADAIRAAGITVKGEGDEQTNVLSPE